MLKVVRTLTLLTCALLVANYLIKAQQAPPSTQLEQGKPIERELKTRETHAYNITLAVGQFLEAAVNQRGVDVVVRVFAPDGSKVAEVDSPNGDQGDEPIAVEAKAAGTYRIEVSPIDENSASGRYEIRINEILSAEANTKRLAEIKAKQHVVIARLKEIAIPLKTVAPGNGFQDLQPLKQVFKDVHFVGLGEETHGTREFFQFKHRMLEFLVKEMGFRVFAIEASYSACENINDYVMGRTSDGAQALDSQKFWTWNTEEIRAMLDWMRAYNSSVPTEKKVKFVGFDIQHNGTGQTKLLEYLRRVAPARAANAEILFKTEVDTLIDAVFSKGDKAKDELTKLKDLRNQYNDLFTYLEISGAQLSARSSNSEWELMREYARVMVQYFDAYTRNGLASVVARDLYMADIFRRIVTREPSGTRFVLWAHNGHIDTGDNDGNYPTFGHYLRQFYGKDYYALGFSFNQGSFQSRETEPKNPPTRMLMSWTVGAAPFDSIDWYLAQTGVKTFFVDLRSPDSKLSEWISSPHPMRSIGSGYAPNFEQAAFGQTTLSKEFDGLFFIDSTTRARPNPSVKNVASQ